MHDAFLDSRRLLHGPWQAFERDVGRLLVANAFEDVRIVGGSGDRGADVLGVKRKSLGDSVQIHFEYLSTRFGRR